MTDPADLLNRAADKLDGILDGATAGPWWSDDSDTCWRLHGVHANIPVTLGGVTIDQVINRQILKAPKSGTPYAEYWPSESDAALIVTMANPFVGRALVAMFRELAWAADLKPSQIEQVGGPEALMLARAILAEREPTDG